MSFKRIQDVPSWMSWVYRILQSSLFSSLLPWRQKKYVKFFFSKRDVLCVCMWEFQLRKKEKSNVQTQHVVERTQNKVVLLNVNCYKSACVCVGCVGHLFVFCPSSIEKKTSLNSNVMLPAAQILYISKLVAPKFDLRYEQQKKLLVTWIC